MREGVAEPVIRIESALGERALQLENQAYQTRNEQLVDELNGRLEQRRRELAALNKLSGPISARRRLQKTLTPDSRIP